MNREYHDGTEPTSLPHYVFCNGPCDQGRKACPCPVACEREDTSMGGFEILGKLIIVFLALVGAGVLVGHFV
jgi:hypothetical protein